MQTQHSPSRDSRFTIATRAGSASALNRAARSAASSPASGGESGAQQITGSVFIDEHGDHILHAGLTVVSALTPSVMARIWNFLAHSANLITVVGVLIAAATAL